MPPKPYTKDFKRNLILAILLAIIGVLLIQDTPNSNSQLHRIASVIDGDTVKLPDDTRVRLIGINAPDKGECFYQESMEYVKNFMQGKQVILEQEISGKDDYGRLLRYVILPGNSQSADRLLVNDHIVRLGHARAVASPPDNRYRDLLISAQEEALRENRGLWQNCEYEDELSGRREQNNPAPGPDYIIKGNISTRGFGKTYLLPCCDNYTTVKIDLSKGEQYFRTEAEAQAAGFRKATNCP